MGTRGRVVLHYKGIYYVLYKCHDAYFSGVGEELVKELKMVADLSLWSRLLELAESDLMPPPQDTAARLEWDDILSKLPVEREGLLSDCFRFPEERGDGFDIDYHGEHSGLERGSMFVEYTYVICLDDEVFHATNYEHHHITRWPIAQIPDDWIEVANNCTGLVSAGWIHKSFFADWEQKFSKVGYKAIERLEHSREAAVWSVMEAEANVPQIIKVFYRSNPWSNDREPVVARHLIESPQSHLVGVLQLIKIGSCDAVVMEKYDGDFLHLIREQLPLQDTAEERQQVVKFLLTFLTMVEHITAGIHELYQLGFVHFDVKYKNILYKKDPTRDDYCFVLCDFEGSCRPVTEETRTRYEEAVGQSCNRSLWEWKWEPYKYNEANLPKGFESLYPWRVDFGTLAVLLRGWEIDDCFQGIIEELEDHSKETHVTLIRVQQLVSSVKDRLATWL